MSFPISTTSAANSTLKLSKKARRETPENLLRHHLDMCSKQGDVSEALRLYDSARAGSIPLSLHHYNVLLYLCSHLSATASEADRAFEIFPQMSVDGVVPNEATFTTLVRLAAARGDPDLAFQFIKTMSAAGITPRLRSYGPALFGFCEKGDVEKAQELEAHMVEAKVAAEELELAALFRLNSELGRGEDVYRLLHRMRAELRMVSETTAELIEGWFNSVQAAGFGLHEWDVEMVNKGVLTGGGGWHGQGWLGKGQWSVGRSEMDKEGVCRRCRDRMMSIDIDPVETEVFARSLAELASQKEAKADFTGFQSWLDRYGPFDAVIDGANVGLNNQHKFSFFQLNYIVNELRQMSSSDKLPLVVLHCSRVRGGQADNSNNKRLLESWRRSGSLYVTPSGSNDDWYWLYAAVNCKCLVVTNDEMRDHLFALLGNSFFPRWKEKHQVRLTVSRDGPTFHLPPPYSIVIQESERGSWHIPTIAGDDIETPRQWVCANRDMIVPSLSHPRLVQI
ncbi:proteinaceous RNase P 1, chloroplastic/mitochondrial [Phalaenopsis equestris]|uniref:proteinaceous RNase P 1, chloroplastic/mitochondrial n=1 Tax=Phalaenopsis equestris TaxID=78828 RepID=UPI0009E61264|nr:proteinaceous RNase P 1, chloroplastic/mitochondrial [Phalaenopsis equestris]